MCSILGPWSLDTSTFGLASCKFGARHSRGLAQCQAGSGQAITPDGLYKMVRGYSSKLGFRVGAHTLRATAATNALDHQADIAKVQEWLGHANIATTRIYDRRQNRAEDSPTFKIAY